MKPLRYLALMLFLSVLAAAQTPAAPAPVATQNTIYVGADGKYESAPDTALIQFGISAQEDTSKAAYDRASRAAQQIRDLLRSNGIDPKEAQIGVFSLEPVYDYRTAKRKLVGYRAGGSVTLKLKDFTKVGPIVQGLSDLDVTDNQTLNYILDNMEEAKAKAAQDAIRKARAEAVAVAGAAQRSIGELIYASVDTYEQPRPMPMRAMATMKAEGAPPPEPTAGFSAQDITVTAHVNAMFALK